MAEEKILARIQKLLALATSNNEAEAALAAEKAQTLLLEYNISEEELNGYSNEKSEKVVEVYTKGKNNQNRSNWFVNLAFVLAPVNLCKLLQTGSGGLIWIGKPTNIEVAQYLFDTLVRDLLRIADIEFQVYRYTNAYNGEAWKTIHGKTWKNNFYHGAIQTIGERLRANLRQLEYDHSNINALVVQNDVELKEYMKIHYPRLSYGSTNSLNFNRSAFESGKAAGRSVSFGKGVGAGGASGPKLIGKG